MLLPPAPSASHRLAIRATFLLLCLVPAAITATVVDGVTVVQGPAPDGTSQVSPVCVEWIEPADVHVTGLTTRGQGVEISALTSARFFANIPLAAAGATAMQATSTKGNRTFHLGWKPTVMTSDGAITLRQGDALLLQFPIAGSYLVTERCGTLGGPVTVKAGKVVPQPFPRPGEFSIVARDAAGSTLATLQVTVAGALVPRTTVAQLKNTRSLSIPVDSPAATYVFTANDPALVTISQAALANKAIALAIKPLVSGTAAKVVARIGSATGPIVAVGGIAAFTVDLAALSHTDVDGLTGIGTSQVIMTPHIPGVMLTFTMFAHASTFAGGAKTLSVSTSDPRFVVAEDPMTHVKSGRFALEIDAPPGEWKYCFSVKASVTPEAAAATSGVALAAAAGAPPATPPITVGSGNVNGDVCRLYHGEGGAAKSTVFGGGTYDVAGNTLAEILGHLPDGEIGTNACGLTFKYKKTTEVCKNPDGTYTGHTTVTPNSIIWAPTNDITLPNASGYGKLSATAKAEWDRFIAALKVHEQGHTDRTVAYAAALNAGTDQDTANAVIYAYHADATAATPEAARTAAEAAMEALTDAEYDVVFGHMNARQDAYDTETNHGATQGAVLHDVP